MYAPLVHLREADEVEADLERVAFGHGMSFAFRGRLPTLQNVSNLMRGFRVAVGRREVDKCVLMPLWKHRLVVQCRGSSSFRNIGLAEAGCW